MDECQSPMQGGKRCGRPLLNSSGAFCIFHETSTKDTDKVRLAFERLLKDEGDGPVDATGFVFPDLVLHKTEVFRHVVFHRCRFLGKALFIETTFHQGADFFEARFEGPVAFNKSILRGGRFQQVNFESEADFSGSQFEGNCDFNQARFIGGAHFASTRFVAAREGNDPPFGYFFFGGAQFKGPVDFSRAHFEHKTTFQKASFADVAMFSHLSLPAPQQGKNLLGQPLGLEPSLDFSDVRVERTDGLRFTGPAAPSPGAHGHEGPLDLSGVRFHGADVARMQFTDVGWGPAPGRRARAKRKDMGAVFDQEETGGPRRWFDWQEDRAAGERLALIYKGLRESYERHLLFAEAGRFHVREMECRRRVYGSWAQARASAAPSARGQRAWKALAAMRRQANLLNAYRLTSNYGESYVRAFWSIAAWFIVVAAFERWLRPRWFPHELGWPHELVNHAIALTPAQVAGESVTAFLGRLVGVFLIAGLIVALRRHFRR